MTEYERYQWDSLMNAPPKNVRGQVVDAEGLICLAITTLEFNQRAGREIYRIRLHPDDGKYPSKHAFRDPSEEFRVIIESFKYSFGAEELLNGATALRRSLHPDQDTL